MRVPVSGAVVKRQAIPSNNKKYTDQVVTGKDGKFEFGRMEASFYLKLLPGDSSIYQKIIIEYESKEYVGWEILAAPDRYKGELNDENIIGTDKEVEFNLNCDLGSKSTQKEGSGLNVVTGICTWPGAKVIK